MAENKAEKSTQVSKEEIEKGKTMAIVTYLGIIGFVIALATDGKSNEYTRFHMNQALPFIIATLVGVIPFLGWILIWIPMIMLIMGLINAAQGNMKRLPMFGNTEMIKK